jgi:hypothetical protein
MASIQWHQINIWLIWMQGNCQILSNTNSHFMYPECQFLWMKSTTSLVLRLFPLVEERPWLGLVTWPTENWLLKGVYMGKVLHASTSALYTSIARSESVLYNQLWESYKIQILAKFGSCLLLNYKKNHAKPIFIATDKSGSQAIKKRVIVCFEIVLMFFRGLWRTFISIVIWKRYKVWIDLLVNFKTILW